MAFEVARVHGLIRSNIGEDGFPLSLSPTSREAQYLNYCHFPAKLNYDAVGYGQWSETSGSPLDSSTCSTETESDEDDELLAGLAEQIAHSMLEDDETAVFKRSPKVNWSTDIKQSPEADIQKSATSPPSSWSSGGWASSSTPSSNRSSRVSSQVSSPPTTPLSVQTDAWDLLYAAAGEVVRQKMDHRRALAFQARVQQQQAQHVHQAQQRAQSHWMQNPLQTQAQAQVAAGFIGGRSPQRLYPAASTSTGLGSCSPLIPRDVHSYTSPVAQRGINGRAREDDRKSSSNQNRSPKGVQAAGWVRHSKSQAAPSPHASRLGNSKNGSGQHRNARTSDCNPAHWHTAPAANGGSGMRAVFLGANGTGRESGGTGVFLPRTAGASDYKRKPACSTVLLPTRIVQVLNLNVEDMRSSAASPCAPVHPHTTRSEIPAQPASPYMMGMSTSLLNPKLCHEESLAMSHRKQLPSHLRQHSAACELSLPTEWTY